MGYPQESVKKHTKYHGYTVRGTPNCSLILMVWGWWFRPCSQFHPRVRFSRSNVTLEHLRFTHFVHQKTSFSQIKKYIFFKLGFHANGFPVCIEQPFFFGGGAQNFQIAGVGVHVVSLQVAFESFWTTWNHPSTRRKAPLTRQKD